LTQASKLGRAGLGDYAIPDYVPEAEAFEPVRLTLDLPPSSNNMFVNNNRGGRVKSQAYMRWRRSALLDMLAQRPGRIAGPYRVQILAGRPTVSSDIDNRVKPILDLLAGQITDDDRHCIGFCAYWSGKVPKGKVEITVQGVLTE
jgi:Holliday junction resolvase RusA-like endonuclease